MTSNPTHVDAKTRLEFRGGADSVRLVTFMPRFPKDIPFEQVEADHWRLDLDLPYGARIEYLLGIEHGNRVEVIKDPANPNTAANPFGENSVATAVGYTTPRWRNSSLSEGYTQEIRVGSIELGGRRRHHVYTPAGFDTDSPLPLLLVHDGSDYVRFAGLTKCVEWLIATGRIRPVRLGLLDPRDRSIEYVASDRHAAHVLYEVLPHIKRRVNTAGGVSAMGASLGAVAAWHLAVQAPDVVDAALLQSGTFAFDPHPELRPKMFASIREFVMSAEQASLPGRVAITCGRYESLIDWNRRVAAAFDRAGAAIRFDEAWAGHDWGAWADRLEDGLAFALAPPHRFSESRSK
jgi:enterochelin esterase family protein